MSLFKNYFRFSLQSYNLLFIRKSYVHQIILFYKYTWVATLLFSPLIYATKNVLGNETNNPNTKDIFFVIIVAPIVETLITQHLIFWICNKFDFFKRNRIGLLFLSAAIFGLMHTYNLGYMIFGFSIGIVFAYVYYFYHHNRFKAYLSVVLIHSLRNATACLLVYLFY